ncbi:hypothetical protein [Euzebya sp.]|uniref:hypothetical protein n=1 Tax=Euzebya sp. TaxID=1971409 RepID=UPI0035154F75
MGGPIEEQDDRGLVRAPAEVVRRVLSGAGRVGEGLASAAVLAHTGSAVDRAREATAAGTPTWKAVDDVVAEHVALARRQGMIAGGALTAVQVTSFWGSAGTLTIPAAIAGLAGDLTSLAWIQARMVTQLAATYGRDPYDRDARVADLLALWEIDGLDDVVAEGRVRWRGALSRLTGPAQRLRTLMHLVGLRSLARRVIPLVNVPLTAAANERATQELADRAIARFAGGRP